MADKLGEVESAVIAILEKIGSFGWPVVFKPPFNST